jgi:hypothetical protein
MPLRYRSSVVLVRTLLAAAMLACSTASESQERGGASADTEVAITITHAPPAGGGPGRMEPIAGRAVGKDVRRYRVVIFSYTDRWYVQPFVAAPFTEIRADGTWASRIHLGTEYAALLVDAPYKPPATAFGLPPLGQGVVAITRTPAR